MATDEEIERLRAAPVGDGAARVRLVDLLVAAGRAAEAVSECRHALAVRPKDVALHLALGRALSSSGDLDEAQGAFQRAMALRDAARATASRTGTPTSAAAVASPSPSPTPPRTLAVGGEATARAPRPPMHTPSSPPPPPVAKRPPPALQSVPGAVPAPLHRDDEPTDEHTLPGVLPDDVDLDFEEPTPVAVEEHDHTPLPLPSPPSRHPTLPHVPSARHVDEDETIRRHVSHLLPQGARGSAPAPSHAPAGPVDLEDVAARLYEHNDTTWKVASVEPAADVDPLERDFDRRRRRLFIVLWTLVGLGTAAVVTLGVLRYQELKRECAADVQIAEQRASEGTYSGDVTAREALTNVLRSRFRTRRDLALATLTSARLYAEHGEETDGAAMALVRRALKEHQKRPQAADPVAEARFAEARVLLALGRGEPCPTDDAGPLLAARCALRRGDLAAARASLTAALTAAPDDARALLDQADVSEALGEIEVAAETYRHALRVVPDHPRAVVGLALMQLEKGQAAKLPPMPPRLGVRGEGWWRLAVGLEVAALGDETKAFKELALAQTAALRDGRLGVRVALGKIGLGNREDGPRLLALAARVDPATTDIPVLDSELAIAKGLEEKVAAGLAPLALTAPPRLLAVRGRAEVLAGKYKDGLASLDAALQKRPGDRVAATYRALARAHTGQDRAARAELEKLASERTTPSTPYFGLGLLAFERNDLKGARTALTKAIDRNPESYRALALLGRVDQKLGRTADAVADLEKARGLNEGFLVAASTLGQLYRELGRDREAKQTLRRVLEAGRGTVDDKLAFAEAALALGQVAEADKLLADAKTAGAPAPRLARDLLVMQSWKSGATALGAARQLDKLAKKSTDGGLLLDTAEAFRRGGDPKRARQLYDQAITVGSDKLHPNLALARMLLAAGDGASAEAAFRAARAAWERLPYGVDDRTEAQVGIGRALIARKDWSAAQVALADARTQDPDAPEPCYWQARALVGLADPVKARAAVERAVALDAGYTEAWQLFGEITEKSDKPAAIKAYGRFLELSTDAAATKAVKRRLAALK